jgi:hypothetical protein
MFDVSHENFNIQNRICQAGMLAMAIAPLFGAIAFCFN